MPTRNPPDNWNMVVGTWGVDADESKAVVASSARSLHLKDTAIATKLQSDFFTAGLGRDVAGLENNIRFKVQADRNSVGDDIKITFETYTKERVLVSTFASTPAPVDTINDWQEYSIGVVGPASGTASLAKISVEKAATDFNAYVDFGKTDPLPAFATSLGVSPVAVPTGTWTIMLAGSTFDRGVERNASGEFIIHQPGLYLMNAQAHWDDSRALRFYTIRANIAPDGVTFGTIIQGLRMVTPANNIPITIQVIRARTLQPKARVRFEVFHDAGISQNLLNDSTKTWAQVIKMVGQ